MAALVGMQVSFVNSKIPEAEAWMGFPVNIIECHGGFSSKSDFETSTRFTLSEMRKVANLNGFTRQLFASAPMVYNGGPSMSQASTGSMDQSWATMAINILAEFPGSGEVWVRLGWECNFSSGFPWAGTNYTLFKSVFRRQVEKFRAVSGGNRFRFDFNCNYGQNDFKNYYPGDDVVDVISFDWYYDSQYFGGQTGTQAFLSIKNHPLGLDALHAFALSRGKKERYAEWGIRFPKSHSLTDADQKGADFIRALGPYIRANTNLRDHAYFNEPTIPDAWQTHRVELDSTRPLTRAAFISEFKPGATTTPPVVVDPPVVVPTDPAMALANRINAEAFTVTQNKPYLESVLATYYTIEDLSYWPRDTGTAPGHERNATEALKLIRNVAFSANKTGWPTAAVTQVNGWYNDAVALVGVAPPVVVVPPDEEDPDEEEPPVDTACQTQLAAVRAQLNELKAAYKAVVDTNVVKTAAQNNLSAVSNTAAAARAALEEALARLL